MAASRGRLRPDPCGHWMVRPPRIRRSFDQIDTLPFMVPNAHAADACLLILWRSHDQETSLSGLTHQSEPSGNPDRAGRSEEHTSELQSRENLVCRLLLEKKTTTRPPRRQTRPANKAR